MWGRDTETKRSTGFFPPFCDLCFTSVSCFQPGSLTLLSTFYSSNIPQLSTSFRAEALWSYHMTFGGPISIQLQRAEQQHLLYLWLNSPATFECPLSYHFICTYYILLHPCCALYPFKAIIVEPDWCGLLWEWYQNRTTRGVSILILSIIQVQIFACSSG